jgi:hypothetical protein
MEKTAEPIEKHFPGTDEISDRIETHVFATLSGDGLVLPLNLN